MDGWLIRFYKNDRGDEYVQDFIRKQDKQTKTKIAKTIDLISIYGPDLGMPHSKYLRDGVYELRVSGKNTVRIFYITITTEREIIFLHAFKKKTQKMPANEFKIAIERRKLLIKI